jgi:hypothetical protein
MSCNKYEQHVLVIPEDDANSQLATGFVLGVAHDRRIQILPAAGGWRHVCAIFVAEHIHGMRKYPKRHLVLLLDFDNQIDRPHRVQENIPEDLRCRVFLLGIKSEPEALKLAGLGSFEQIGRNLAKECVDGTQNLWSHELLKGNAGEIIRLGSAVRPFLF